MEFLFFKLLSANVTPRGASNLYKSASAVAQEGLVETNRT